MNIQRAVVVVLIVIGIFGLMRIAITPAPGKKMNDLGRDHVSFDTVEKTLYASNPPTSGPHLSTWVKPGVYDAPQNEGELIHSLEHGYVVMHYNCGVHLNTWGRVPRVFAHEDEDVSSPSAVFQYPSVATGSAKNDSESCKSLVSSLESIAKQKTLFKLIIVPRPQLDTTIALTAWNYIDKFDSFDAKRIEKFIDYHRDHGPEKTME